MRDPERQSIHADEPPWQAVVRRFDDDGSTRRRPAPALASVRVLVTDVPTRQPTTAVGKLPEKKVPDGKVSDGMAALAGRWAAAALSTSHVALPRVDIEAFLLEVACGLATVLRGEPFDPCQAAEAGAALVSTNLTGNQALNETVKLLGRDLLAAADLPFDEHWHGRLIDVIGALSSGYVDALRERLFDQQEMIKKAVFRARDIAERARRATEARWRAVFLSTAAGIAITDLDGTVQSVNPALCEILGATEDQLLDRPLATQLSPAYAAKVLAAFGHVANGQHDKFVGDASFLGQDGELVWTRLSLSLVRDAAQEPEYAVAVVENISDLHLLRERQLRMSLEDQLTGLPNRARFMAQLDTALQHATADENIALVYVDLDGFKIINDGVDHSTGDKVLKRVATTLRAAFAEPTAMVARMGGDGFAILLTDSKGSYPISQRIAAALAELAEPEYEEDGTGIAVSASVGIVERPATSMTSTELVRAAEITVHRAKQNGKAQWELFDDRLDAEYRSQYQLGAAIPGALESGQFQLSYQPVKRITDGRTVALRALLHWHHPRRGLLRPAEFLDMAEETGFIVPMGRWMLDQVCQQLADWERAFGRAALPMCIHLTARLAREQDLVQMIRDVLDQTGAPAAKLRLSVPASVVVDDHGEPLENLDTLRDIKVSAIMHGFGTGNAGLVDLRTLPVDGVTIAPSVVKAFGGMNEQDSPFEHGLRQIVELANQLDVRVYADGVDTAAVAERLSAVGVLYGAGTALGEPLTVSEVERLLSSG
ncbi:MAG TPA: EAL domain-containing protein [Pseudonocardiaceae bacterium]|nr:EAL domain-containing protein [Pseudonocardiaceae bacterium]